MNYIAILIGLGAGIVSAFIGYVKNLPKESSNQIDWLKALPSLILGAVAGIYAGYMGIDLISAQAIVITAGTVALTNQVVSFISNWIKSKKLNPINVGAPIKPKKKK